MGKKIRVQRRGKGSPTFKSRKNAVADSSYLPLDESQKKGILKGNIVELHPCPGRTSALAEILFENKRNAFVTAAEGLFVGQRVEFGKKASLSVGNVLFLSDISEGCPVFAVENVPGDGGTLVRASGLYALVMAKEKQGVFVKLPSGKIVCLNSNCRATVGNASGGGRTEKPFVKAGAMHYAMFARGKKYPVTRGVAMNAHTHPFGGSGHHAGKSKSVSRNAPPGRKVGAIASKRTGRRKR